MSVGIARDDERATAAETPADRAARVRREAAVIAAGEAEIEAGLGMPEEAFEAWIAALDADPDAPLPVPGGSTPRRWARRWPVPSR